MLELHWLVCIRKHLTYTMTFENRILKPQLISMWSCELNNIKPNSLIKKYINPNKTLNFRNLLQMLVKFHAAIHIWERKEHSAIWIKDFIVPISKTTKTKDSLGWLYCQTWGYTITAISWQLLFRLIFNIDVIKL